MPVIYSKPNLTKIERLHPFKIDYSRVANLEYTDKNQQLPQTFAEYVKVVPPAGIVTEEQPRPLFPADLNYLQTYNPIQFPKGKMLVLVNYDLYPAISRSLNQYIMDVGYEGYYATAYRVRNGTAQELHNFIKNNAPITGALLVGDLTAAWFEMADDFHGAAEFPCDLYYMDLNGTWNDPDNDGKFSEHPTGVEPEIWIGRLWTPSGNGNDAALLNDYFSRNHQFRKGQFGYSMSGLAYVDDDWVGFNDCALDMVLPAANIETIVNPATTDVDRYKAEINQQRAWAQVCAHSSPGGHSFKIPGGSEWVPNTYLRDINPPNAYFYNLFACSNALFTQAEYMAGWYIFDKPNGPVCNGLAAIGSTKSGSMLLFENFYGPMGAGKTIGEAYVDWWRALGNTHDLGKRQWYYGLVLLGDPTLNWWSGVVPQMRNPMNCDTFDHFPRLTIFNWDAIGLPGVSYHIEIDAFGAKTAGKWAAGTGQTFFVSGAMAANMYENLFVGAQRGRWRVRAKIGNQLCPWSDWWYFAYTI
jgi:hypothetical protein